MTNQELNYLYNVPVIENVICWSRVVCVLLDCHHNSLPVVILNSIWNLMEGI